MLVKRPGGPTKSVPDAMWPSLQKKGFVAVMADKSEVGDLEAVVTPGFGTVEISVIVLCWNNLELTKACVASILEHTTRPFELILVDNGSTDGTPDWIRALEAQDARVRVLLNPTNRGVAGGRNDGIRASQGRFLAFFDNDSTVGAGWDTIMLSVLETRPRAGFVGRMGSAIFDYTQEGIREITLLTEQPLRCDVVSGGATMIRREVFDEVGLLDEWSLGEFWHEDMEICLRAALAGWRSYAVRFPWLHATHSSYKAKRGEKWMDGFQKNLDTIAAKLDARNILELGIGKAVFEPVAEELTRRGWVVIKRDLPRSIPLIARRHVAASLRTYAGTTLVLDVPEGVQDRVSASLRGQAEAYVATSVGAARKLTVELGMLVEMFHANLDQPDIGIVASEVEAIIEPSRNPRT